MNVELALRVKERILAEPGHLWMNDWVCNITDDGKKYFGRGALDCGTAGCIAGHVAFEVLGKEVALALFTHEVEGVAQRALGLTENEAEMLFMFFDVEYQAYEGLQDALAETRPGTPEYAAVVARAIDRCIERNGGDKGVKVESTATAKASTNQEEMKCK